MTGYALVGSLGAINDNGGSSGTGSASFGQSTTAGDLLIAWLESVSTSTTGSNPFSTSSSGWTLAGAIGQAFNWVAVYYKADCGAGETAPTFAQANPAGGGSWWIRLAEFSGGATSTPLDQTGSTDGSNNVVTASAGAADAAAGDLIIASAGYSGTDGGTAVTLTMTDSNGNPVTNTLTTENNGNQWCGFAWGVTGTPLGTHADTATATQAGVVSVRADIVIASFKPAATFLAPPNRPRGQAVNRASTY